MAGGANTRGRRERPPDLSIGRIRRSLPSVKHNTEQDGIMRTTGRSPALCSAARVRIGLRASVRSPATQANRDPNSRPPQWLHNFLRSECSRGRVAAADSANGRTRMSRGERRLPRAHWAWKVSVLACANYPTIAQTSPWEFSGTSKLVSRGTDGVTHEGASGSAVNGSECRRRVAALTDGRHVAFESRAQLTPGDHGRG
jgi:hypothetical protein